MGICALCCAAAELRASHIIPEFAYAPLYDDKHRLIAVCASDPARFEVAQRGMRFRLLCDRCEAFLNTKYEYPFKKFWIDGAQVQKAREDRCHVVDGVDYLTFKLFHLSILWRASLCSHPAFDRVRLGRHADVLRTMLRNGDPGPQGIYPIGCSVIDDGSNRGCNYSVTSPVAVRLCGHRGYVFAFAGCRWLYVVSSHRLWQYERCFLSERGFLPASRSSFSDILVGLVHDRSGGAHGHATQKS